MPGILSKEVLFNDGEGLVYADLNNMQRYANATLLDGILSRLARPFAGSSPLGADSTFDITNLFCVGNDAAPYAGAGNREIKNLAGTIYQRIDASPDGNDSGFLAYYVTADEYNQTLDAGVSDPRYDLLSVKLEYISNDAADNASRDFKDATSGVVTTTSVVKKRKVKATFTVTKGTESGSPVEPSLPAGHVKVASFLVTPSMTVFDPRANEIRDWRMPLGYRVDQVQAKEMLKNETFWTDDIFWMDSTVDDAFAYAVCPAGGLCRLVGVTVAAGKSTNATNSTATLIRLPSTDVSLAPVTIVELRSAIFPSATAGIKNSDQAIASLLSYPVWSNGFTAGYAVEAVQADLGSPSPPDDANAWNALAMAFSTQDANEIRVAWIRWHLMGAF